MNYIKNIDTIYILVDIQSYENSTQEIIKYLEEEKINAKLADNTKYQHMIKIGDMNFQIFSNGTKGYSYILHNDGYQINISQFRSKIQSFYPLQIRISSEFLWSKGIVKAWSEIYQWIEENFGKVIDTKVYRIDLCLHTSDIDFITDCNNKYKGKFKKYKIDFNGLNSNSICFGTRKGKNIYCRIYNKTLEIRETNSKTWFYEIWKENKLNIENVWNLEFELKSEFLRELKLTTIEDVCSCLPNLWRYCTEKWLVMVDRVNTRIERCPTNEKWSEIQKAFDEFNSKPLIERQKQISTDADILIPSIIGYITSYSARKNDTDIDSVFDKLQKETIIFFKKKESTFDTEVLNKKKRIQIYERREKTYE